MAIDVTELRSRTLEPEVADELDRFEETVAQYLGGEIDDEVFRVFRLNQGVYGQRQGGHNQMLRVKVPHGPAISPWRPSWPPRRAPTATGESRDLRRGRRR